MIINMLYTDPDMGLRKTSPIPFLAGCKGKKSMRSGIKIILFSYQRIAQRVTREFPVVVVFPNI
jgi:hypothetical protein